MATGSIDTDASLVYNYHRMHMPLATPQLPADPSTAIFVLCSFDTRVAVRAAELYHAGHGHHLIFSGNVSVLTSGRFTLSEAEHFANVARGLGVPDAAIIVETRATNTGENVRFTSALLAERGLLAGPGRIRRFLLVQKPYMERRTYATFVKQWPKIDGEEEVEFSVTSPVLEWHEYLNEENDRDIVMNAMIPQDIQQDVWDAGQRLIVAGYGKHLP